MLTDEGTTLVKVFLNVSREEQGRRLQERLDNPEKMWKFRARISRVGPTSTTTSPLTTGC
jgi:polyphosphate kinase 2 (PPK2 family)